MSNRAKKQKLAVVEIVERRYFKHRVCPDSERFGDYLYGFFVHLLESIGEETDFIPSGMNHIRFYSQVDSNHKTRKFIVKAETAMAIVDFKLKGYDEMEEFAKSNREKGKNILMQLNNGELSLSDFDKKR